MKADNAIIMAAGTSSRFAPLSFERPKALIEVKGEILIERQIRQLMDAGITEVFVVTGYKAEQFDYLKNKFGVKLINNPDYLIRNNNSSIWAARNILANSYICSADNYFTANPFDTSPEYAYYAAEYSVGATYEWCMKEDADGNICDVTIGGENAWYMIGHTFWSREFSERFIRILEQEYYASVTAGKLWEQLFIEHLDELKMRIKKYPSGIIMEFDTLEELRAFDPSYVDDTRSKIIKGICRERNLSEKEIRIIDTIKDKNNDSIGFEYEYGLKRCNYYY